MKIFEEELKDKHEQRRNSKITHWSNWVIKILLLLFLLLLIRSFGSEQIKYFKKLMLGNHNATESQQFVLFVNSRIKL